MTDHWPLFILGTIALIALVLATAVIVVPVIMKRRAIKALRQRTRGRLVLTFDDGPGEKLLPELLELLQRQDIRATFFLVGFRADRLPDTCDLMRDAGHELGCHTHWHRKPWRTWPWVSARDVDDGYQSMARWLSPDAPFRPPFGKLLWWSYRAATRRGAPICYWTHDSGDTWPVMPKPRDVVDTLIQDGGGVALMHCHDREEDRHQHVLQVTELLLNAAQSHGLTVCTMMELLNSSTEKQAQENHG